MFMKKAVIFASLAAVAVLFLLRGGDAGISPLPDEQVELTKVLEGTTFKVMLDGKVYRVEEPTGLWHYHDTVYDPVAMETAYRGKEMQYFDAIRIAASVFRFDGSFAKTSNGCRQDVKVCVS